VNIKEEISSSDGKGERGEFTVLCLREKIDK